MMSIKDRGDHNSALPEKSGGVQKPGNAFIICLAVLLGIYLAFSLPAPRTKIRQFNVRYGEGDPAKTSPAEKPTDHPVITHLARKGAFLESRIGMAGTDSIGLAINLEDSTVSLEINGVILHNARISRYNQDGFFNAIDNQAFNNFLSGPLTIKKYRSTIIKEPVITRKAPKDTTDIDAIPVLPDTILNKPAYVLLVLDEGIRIYMNRESRGSFRNTITRFSFYAMERLREAFVNTISILFLKIPDYKPCLKIYLPGRDIVTIYRALPENSRVALLPHTL